MTHPSHLNHANHYCTKLKEQCDLYDQTKSYETINCVSFVTQDKILDFLVKYPLMEEFITTRPVRSCLTTIASVEKIPGLTAEMTPEVCLRALLESGKHLPIEVHDEANDALIGVQVKQLYNELVERKITAAECTKLIKEADPVGIVSNKISEAVISGLEKLKHTDCICPTSKSDTICFSVHRFARHAAAYVAGGLCTYEVGTDVPLRERCCISNSSFKMLDEVAAVSKEMRDNVLEMNEGCLCRMYRTWKNTPGLEWKVTVLEVDHKWSVSFSLVKRTVLVPPVIQVVEEPNPFGRRAARKFAKEKAQAKAKAAREEQLANEAKKKAAATTRALREMNARVDRLESERLVAEKAAVEAAMVRVSSSSPVVLPSRGTDQMPIQPEIEEDENDLPDYEEPPAYE